jgi:hypothetical protein
MLLTPHAVMGATVGALIDKPVLALPVAIASHYLLDAVPHWQETLPPYTPHAGTWVRIPIDIGLGAGLATLIARRRPADAPRICAAAVAAVLPDVDSLLPASFRDKSIGPLGRYLRWHVDIQRETASLWGVLPQLVVALGGLALSARADTRP